jgi:L-ribulose-5-phosphate 4-epimerase
LTESERTLRAELARFARQMVASGLVRGTSGNISARMPGADRCLITPSGVDYDTLEPEDMVVVGLDGERDPEAPRPSVDTPVHLALYRARADVAACIHTHSPYAAAFSIVGREIPPLLAESAGYLGAAVRVLGYVPPARPDTGEQVAAGMGLDRAVLLPNHGVFAVGENVKKCFGAAMAVEDSARVAFIAFQLGTPNLVPPGEVDRMHEFIHHQYGQR